MPAASSRRVLLLLAGLAVAGAAAIALARWLAPGDPSGLVVHVEVVDETGEPLRGRVQARYQPGWRALDAQGRTRLPGVLLPAGARPTPEAVAAAVTIDVPRHAVPPGREAPAERREDGTWALRQVLVPHGEVRLVVLPTTLRGVRAWIDADPRRGDVVPADGPAIARSGQVAAWHVFAGEEPLLVRLEGDEGVAARRVRIPRPAPGFVRELLLAAEPSAPIEGHVVAPAGPAVPILAGRLAVREMTDDGPLRYDDVVIRPDGSFRVPYTGAGTWRLDADVGFLADVPPVLAEGGEEVSIVGGRLRPWATLEASSWGPPGRDARVLLRDAAGRRIEAIEHGVLREDDTVYVALPGPDRYELQVIVPGDEHRPPRRGRAPVDARGVGPHPVTPRLEVLPHGAVHVRLAGAPAQVGGGATVTVVAGEHERERSILAALDDEARLANVRAGRVEVRVRFQPPDTALVLLRGEVPADGTLEVEAEAVVGGHVQVEDPNAAPADTAPRRLAWEAGDAPYPGAGAVELIRRGSAPRWETRVPLRPGRYRARLEGPAGTEARAIELEIVAGRGATVVPPGP